MLKIAFIVVVVCAFAASCPYHANCDQCTVLPHCVYMEFYSGLSICVPSDYQQPNDEYLIRTFTWPSECVYAQPKALYEAASPEGIREDRIEQVDDTSLSDDSYTAFNICVGVFAILSFLITLVELWYRCKKIRQEAEEQQNGRFNYRRFYNNEFIEPYPLH